MNLGVLNQSSHQRSICFKFDYLPIACLLKKYYLSGLLDGIQKPPLFAFTYRFLHQKILEAVLTRCRYSKWVLDMERAHWIFSWQLRWVLSHLFITLGRRWSLRIPSKTPNTNMASYWTFWFLPQIFTLAVDYSTTCSNNASYDTVCTNLVTAIPRLQLGRGCRDLL